MEQVISMSVTNDVLIKIINGGIRNYLSLIYLPKHQEARKHIICFRAACLGKCLLHYMQCYYSPTVCT